MTFFGIVNWQTMKRNGSIILTQKRKRHIQTHSDDEDDDRLYNNESNDAGQEHEDEDDDLADGSEEEHVSDEEDDDGQDSNEEEEEDDDVRMDSNEEEDVEADGASGEGEEGSEQNDDGDEATEESSTAKIPTPRNKVKRVKPLIKTKQKKTGVIYISSIPKHMNVTILRSLLEPFGDLGRIFLQPAQKGMSFAFAMTLFALLSFQSYLFYIYRWSSSVENGQR